MTHLARRHGRSDPANARGGATRSVRQTGLRRQHALRLRTTYGARRCAPSCGWAAGSWWVTPEQGPPA